MIAYIKSKLSKLSKLFIVVKLFKVTSLSKLSLLSLIVLASSLYAHLAQALPSQPDSNQIQIDLQTAPIESMTPMKEALAKKGYTAEFWGEVYLVHFKNEDKAKSLTKAGAKSNTKSKAVFKPRTPDELQDAYAELSAYKASTYLGFPNIPPTVIRTINGKTGSLQLYIEPHQDPTNPENYKNALAKADKEDLANLKLFYFVFGQWDSGGHNLIISKENDRLISTEKDHLKLFAIDNEGIINRQYVKYGDLPFVRVCYSDKLNTNDWDQPFPFEKKQILQNPTLPNLRKTFKNTLPESKLQELARFQRALHYVIYKNSLWVQFHKEDKDFVLSHTIYYPEKSIQQLKSLNKEVLRKIFAEAKTKRCEFLTEEYLNAILERRDQVIASYEKL